MAVRAWLLVRVRIAPARAHICAGPGAGRLIPVARAHARTHTRLLLLGRTQVISGFVAAMKFSQLIGPGACVLVGTRRVLVSTRRLSPCRNSGVVALQPLRRCVAAIMAQGCATWRRCYMVQQ